MEYGYCVECGYPLEPVYFEEKEEKIVQGIRIPTGRVRTAVNYLYCPMCGHKEVVDDTFDEPWRN